MSWRASSARRSRSSSATGPRTTQERIAQYYVRSTRLDKAVSYLEQAADAWGPGDDHAAELLDAARRAAARAGDAEAEARIAARIAARSGARDG